MSAFDTCCKMHDFGVFYTLGAAHLACVISSKFVRVCMLLA